MNCDGEQVVSDKQRKRRVTTLPDQRVNAEIDDYCFAMDLSQTKQWCGNSIRATENGRHKAREDLFGSSDQRGEAESTLD